MKGFSLIALTLLIIGCGCPYTKSEQGQVLVAPQRPHPIIKVNHDAIDVTEPQSIHFR